MTLEGKEEDLWEDWHNSVILRMDEGDLESQWSTGIQICIHFIWMVPSYISSSLSTPKWTPLLALRHLSTSKVSRSTYLPLEIFSPSSFDFSWFRKVSTAMCLNKHLLCLAIGSATPACYHFSLYDISHQISVPDFLVFYFVSQWYVEHDCFLCNL